MIPILPCRTLDETLTFFEACGFAVTERQTRPNPYAEVRHDLGIVLQFYGQKDYAPGGEYHTCYALLDDDADIDALHAGVRGGLRAAYGRIPLRGLPRVGALGDMAYGVRQFLLTDPVGNQVRIGRRTTAAPAPSGTRLDRALTAARALADSKEDPATAARVLDPVLDDARAAAPAVRVRALVLRAALAVTLDDRGLASGLLTEARSVPLDEEQRAALHDDLARAGDFAEELAEHVTDTGSTSS